MGTHYAHTMQVKDFYVNILNKDGEVLVGLPVRLVEAMHTALTESRKI